MSYQLIRGNALSLPLADESVDLICTSPPYFALRSYTDGGEHYEGQIGSEATPQAFLEALWAVTAECVRVLKPSGSLWVNLGDKYAGSGGHNNSGISDKSTLRGNGHTGGGPKIKATRRSAPDRYNRASDGIPAKSLMLLPQRYAIGCIDNLNLICRAEVIWCLSGGARIYAEIHGKPWPIMMRDLVRHYQPEDVRLWNGDKWTQVRGWNRSPDTDGALELELRSGERIGCTPGHQWPTARGLVRADDIRVGDIIDTVRLPEGAARTPAGLDDADVGWLGGLYMAEGSRSGTIIQFAGHTNETARHARLARIAAAFDGECNTYRTGENTTTCNLSGSVLVGIIDRYLTPGTAKSKRLTMHAWQRSDAFLAGIIAGYLEGDGHYDAKNDRWRLGFTANDEWAADLRTLAARLGAALTLKRCTHHGNYGDFPGWRGEWRFRGTTHHNTKPRGEVVAIRRSRARQFFDVGVADDPHTFALASGVLTHNSKPNGLPESVTDRVRRSHEQWFHMTKEPRYFSAVDEVREAHVAGPRPNFDGSHGATPKASRAGITLAQDADRCGNNPLGKLPGSVWQIPTEPLRVPDHLGVDHFAAFPSEWPRRIILGWSPSGVCVACGEGRRPVVAKEKDVYYGAGEFRSGAQQVKDGAAEVGWKQDEKWRTTATITGYACACPDTTAPTRPAVVLDPFAGTGTTVAVAHALGRHGIGIDLSADYLRLAEWRCNNLALAEKVADRSGMAAPKGEHEGMEVQPLFGGAS